MLIQNRLDAETCVVQLSLTILQPSTAFSNVRCTPHRFVTPIHRCQHLLTPTFYFFLKIGWIFSTGSCKTSAGEPAVTFETRKLLWVGEVASLCRHCRDLIGSGNYETKRDGAGAHVNHVSQLLCWEQHSPRICSRLFGVIRYVPAPKVIASQTSWEWIDNGWKVTLLTIHKQADSWVVLPV